MHPVFEKIAFYIAPHQDDWQLFYGHEVADDLATSKVKVIFIYITAGDAGRADGWWQAREKAALFSSSPEAFSTQTVRINSHLLTKYIQKNSVSYCLRLPDGMPSGKGSSLYGHSLSQLQKSPINIRTVDNSTTYSSWEDFCTTLNAIISWENTLPEESVWIHAPEYSPLLNPDDHADHKAVADAIRSISESYNRAWWQTYSIYYHPANLSSLEIQRKRERFEAYSKKMEQLTKTSPNELEWICWGHQGYSRRILRSYPDLIIESPLTDYLQRCGIPLETHEPEGLKITNQLTQKSVLLNETAQVFWNLLRSPYALSELTSIFEEIYPGSSIQHLLEPLLSAKFIKYKEIASS